MSATARSQIGAVAKQTHVSNTLFLSTEGVSGLLVRTGHPFGENIEIRGESTLEPDFNLAFTNHRDYEHSWIYFLQRRPGAKTISGWYTTRRGNREELEETLATLSGSVSGIRDISRPPSPH